MQMRSMVKHGYTQTGGSSITHDKISENNKYKIYEGDFKNGDEVLNFKGDNLASCAWCSKRKCHCLKESARR